MSTETSNRINYPELFRDYLKEHGYPADSISKSTHISPRGIPCDCIEIRHNEKVIQAFALMPDRKRTRHSYYPFFRQYEERDSQKPSKTVAIKPPCSIACHNDKDGSWSFYDASKSNRERPLDSTINYELAVIHFFERWNNTPIIKLQKKVRRVGRICAFSLIAYFLFYLITQLYPSIQISVPFDMSVLTLFAVVAILLLLPDLLPYINKISRSSIDLDFD